MRQATGELIEITLENGLTGGRLLCPQNLVPAPGQYLLAHGLASDALLAAPIFSAGLAPGGFFIAPPIPPEWRPGISLSLYGPLGRGFSLPTTAHCIALVALGETTARLNPLLAAALKSGASIVVVSELVLAGLPPEVEVQPVSALPDVAKWADYLALDLPRESLPWLRGVVGSDGKRRPDVKGVVHPVPQTGFLREALVLTPMPCGGMAECGVCAVTVRRGWKLTCKDGPVFDLDELF
jgi:hypothetical protein